MSIQLEQDLRAAVSEFLRRTYEWTPATLVVEIPPRTELGDFALPVSFELAKRLRRPPRQIAQEIATALPLPPGMARAEAAGAGYLNFFADRATAWAGLASGASSLQARLGGKVIVEHTNINPNKAAHIGHLRNAVLGDTWVRLLRGRGEQVEVQNLQDNTGVQVADVVAAFLYLSPADGDAAAARRLIEAAIADPNLRFDYLCWDRYAEISQHYEHHPDDLAAWRPRTLHAVEAGANPVAEVAELISTAIAHCHLRTMARIGVVYDVLPRESEILQLQLWKHAFNLLQQKAAIRLESSGKNAGCWVMDRATQDAEGEDETKVMVRSNGTVTYVAKDLAYQLWKFGLLPLEFGFVPFHQDGQGHWAWTTALTGQPDAPAFGHGSWVFNVIDARQSYLQEIVAAGLQALGFSQQAARSVHFSYEMVALSAACAAELGYAPSADGGRVDVSGRKGTGVKADDLLNRLEARTQAEVLARHPDRSEAERTLAAHQIAVGALRYFLLKFTRSTVIAFDFKEALSFEGESGPYVQYAAVRAGNILRKAEADPDVPGGAGTEAAGLFLQDEAIWGLVAQLWRLETALEQAIATQEPAYIAKYAFQLSQDFNNFYHHTPVLQEQDPEKRAFLIGLVRLLHRQLSTALDRMGMEVPAFM